MNTTRHYEISLKLLLSLGALALFCLVGWSGFFVGLFVISLFWFFYSRRSTRWLLKRLDLGPDAPSNATVMLNKQAEQIAQKYQMPTPKIYRIEKSIPLVMGFGNAQNPIIVISQNFYDKLSLAEKNSLLEMALYKIESGYTKNIEFATLLNLAIIDTGSKLDLLLALITGLKNKKNHGNRNYLVFARLFGLGARLINSVYIRKSFFFKVDDVLFQTNPYLLLTFKKAQLYTPKDTDSVEPLLCAFNFCNLPVLTKWERRFQRQPEFNERIETLQKEKNLMVESLTFS